MELFCADTIYIGFFFSFFLKNLFAHENMKNPLSNFAHNPPKLFFQYVLATSPKPAQITFSVP